MVRPVVWALLVSLLGGFGGALGQTAAAIGADNPRSRIGRPLDRGPAFLTVSQSVGSLPAYGGGGGHCVGVLLRPLRAADLFNPCYAWNSALILQVDVQNGGDERRIVSADLVLRRYGADMRLGTAGSAFFWGLGGGASRVTVPASDGRTGPTTGLSGLVEAGFEQPVKAGLVLLLEAQYRLYRHDGLDYSSWGFQLGLAVPVPL